MYKHKATKIISAPNLNRLEKEINEFLNSIPSDNLHSLARTVLASPERFLLVLLVLKSS
ncbi:MAG: hypothetical protein UU01_C0035G0006 [Parcubacteria group bacterium GW2011_GWA2_40_37]|nr:MAG: hypothetical protein UU01_C0035G0006 [Parcubacteria group bacterium GW2011_GWA2_40_37]